MKSIQLCIHSEAVYLCIINIIITSFISIIVASGTEVVHYLGRCDA